MKHSSTLLLVGEQGTEDWQQFVELLMAQNYQIVRVQSGEAAIHEMHNKTVELVLMDTDLPGMDGFETCQSLKLIESLSNIPILLVSAQQEPENRLKGFQVGAIDYIIKPFYPEEVLARIQVNLKRVTGYQEQKKHQDHNGNNSEIKGIVKSHIFKNYYSLSQLVSHFPGLIYRCQLDAKQTIEFASGCCRSLIGYSSDYFIGQSRMSYNQLIHPEDRIVTEKQQHLALLHGQPFELMYRLITASGQIKWVLEQGKFVYDEKGKKVALEGFITDISAQKQTESALQRKLERTQKKGAFLVAANQELQRLAIIDELTGIANRRQFNQTFQQEWERLKRERLPFSLILCDVDYFKYYNDYYGHQCGDDCLVKVAQAIRQAVKRPADLVSRYGGEEFAVILPNTELIGAVQVAKLIQREIRQMKIIHGRSPISSYITLSLGISCIIPSQNSSSHVLIAGADQALYQAKQKGRDRYCIYPFHSSQESCPLTLIPPCCPEADSLNFQLTFSV